MKEYIGRWVEYSLVGHINYFIFIIAIEKDIREYIVRYIRSNGQKYQALFYIQDFERRMHRIEEDKNLISRLSKELMRNLFK